MLSVFNFLEGFSTQNRVFHRALGMSLEQSAPSGFFPTDLRPLHTRWLIDTRQENSQNAYSLIKTNTIPFHCKFLRTFSEMQINVSTLMFVLTHKRHVRAVRPPNASTGRAVRLKCVRHT